MTSIELVDCENVLLTEIGDGRCTRDDVAMTYAMSLVSSERDSVDWEKVNKAIIERWSMNALVYIKTRAWKKVEGK